MTARKRRNEFKKLGGIYWSVLNGPISEEKVLMGYRVFYTMCLLDGGFFPMCKVWAAQADLKDTLKMLFDRPYRRERPLTIQPGAEPGSITITGPKYWIDAMRAYQDAFDSKKRAAEFITVVRA